MIPEKDQTSQRSHETSLINIIGSISAIECGRYILLVIYGPNNSVAYTMLSPCTCCDHTHCVRQRLTSQSSNDSVIKSLPQVKKVDEVDQLTSKISEGVKKMYFSLPGCILLDIRNKSFSDSNNVAKVYSTYTKCDKIRTILAMFKIWSAI